MTLNVGLIGAGMIGHDHARRLERVVAGARVSAVADVDLERARDLAAGMPGALTYASGHDIIASPQVDAVVVASSGPTHEPYVLAAIAAGKPVFCEKPLAPGPDACLRIVEAEVASGRHLVQVGFMRRYDPGYQAMRQALRDGLIGAPLLAHCAHRNPSVPGTYTSDMPLTDTAVHEMDAMRWLLADEVVAVSVLLPRRNGRAPSHLADPQVLLMETATGTLVDVEINLSCAYGYDIRCELVGETGTVTLDSPAGCTLRGNGTASQAIPADWRERFGPAYDAELQVWADTVAAGHDGCAAGAATSWDGYKAAAICEAALAALDSGQRTPVVTKDRPAFYADAASPRP
ncbi:MAG TPA: Gfo/Idh/MocA family oxidoreductase [Streptosporangiaceae bacterium]|nr:Gfo/Idh/MocA family oxidoreductase [Streptosporangiaceae bacterium]